MVAEARRFYQCPLLGHRLRSDSTCTRLVSMLTKAVGMTACLFGPGLNRSLQDSDVVIWYTLGVTHIPRPEEWPIMSVHSAGFKLVLDGFFDQNPAVDVPK